MLFLQHYVAACACTAALPVSAGTGEPDTHLWTELNVTGPLATNTTITGIARLRFSETLPNPTLISPGVDLNYRAGEWTISAGYRYDATAQREPMLRVCEALRDHFRALIKTQPHQERAAQTNSYVGAPGE